MRQILFFPSSVMAKKKKQLNWSIFTFFLTLLLFYYSSIVQVGHCEYPQDFCCPSLSLFTQSKWGIFGNLHWADTWEKVPEQEYLLLLRPVMQGESAMAVDVWAHLRKAKRCGHWLTIWNRSAIRLLMAVQLSAQKKWTLSSCSFCFQRCGLSIVYNHDGHYIMDHSNCKAKLLRSIFKANFLSIIAMEGQENGLCCTDHPLGRPITHSASEINCTVCPITSLSPCNCICLIGTVATQSVSYIVKVILGNIYLFACCVHLEQRA